MPIVQISAPSRLHFGMLSFKQPGVRQFGGVGAMIGGPRLEIRLSPAAALSAAGPLADRALQFARRAAASWGLAEAPRCRIEILSAPPAHAGLGSGTQLGMALAAGLGALVGRPLQTAADLARAVDRGGRSAIGLYGFAQGGLLVEAGKSAASDVSPLIARVPLPEAWRFVLLHPEEEGLSGEAERLAFEQLPPVPKETTARLAAEALLGLLPSAVLGGFEDFSASLERFSKLAGSCFAMRQGGEYMREDLVRQAMALGAKGVGQSSWGPTVFVVLPDQDAADQFMTALGAGPRPMGASVWGPDNRGARLTVAGDEGPAALPGT